MPRPPTSCRIAAETNDRLKTLLKNSRLSRDQFVDYLLEEAMDQIEAEAPPHGTLPHILVLRRELKKADTDPVIERIERLEAAERFLRGDPGLRAAESPPARKTGTRP